MADNQEDLFCECGWYGRDVDSAFKFGPGSQTGQLHAHRHQNTDSLGTQSQGHFQIKPKAIGSVSFI